MTILNDAKEHFKNFKRDIKSTANILIKSSTKWGKISSVPSVDVDIVLTFTSGTEMDFIQWFMLELVENVPELSFSLNYHRNADEYALYITSSYQNLLRGAESLCIRKKVVPEFGGGYRDFNLDELDLFENVSEETLFLTSQERQSIVKYWLYTLRSRCVTNKFGIQFLKEQLIVPILVSKQKISQIFPLHHHEMLKHLGEIWVTKFRNPQPLNDIASYFGVKIALYFAWLGHYTIALLIPTLIGLIGWLVIDQKNHDIYYVLTALLNIIWATFYLKHWRRTSNELTYKWGTIDCQIDLLSEERPSFKGELQICPLTGKQIKYYPNWKRQCTVYFVSLPIIFFCVLCVIETSLIFSNLQVWIDNNIQEKNWLPILSPIPKVLLAFVIGFMDDIFKKIAVKLNKWENHRLEDSYRNFLMAKLILFQFMNSFFSLFYIAFYLKDLVKLREQLATLLIIRQFIGNIKEIIMPFVNTRVRQTIMGIRYEKRKQDTMNIMKQCQAKLQKKQMLHSSSNEIDGDEVSTEPVVQNKRPDDLNIIEQTESRDNNELPTDSESQEKVLSKSDVSSQDFECTSSSGSTVHKRQSLRSSKGPVKRNNKTGDLKSQSDFSGSKRSSVCALTPGETTLYQAEEEATLPKYDDPFEDFLEMFIQFGYVNMFACAFPLAGLFCLLNNILEIRSDAFKLISSYQRPFGANVSSIGVWQVSLEALSYVTVAVNMCLLGVSGGLDRIMKGYSTEKIILSIVALEHFIILVKYLINQSIPNVPYWIEQERSVIEHRRREALKAIEKESMKERRRHRVHSCDPPEPHNEPQESVIVTRSKSKIDQVL